MKKVLVGVLALIGSLVVLAVIGVAVFGLLASMSKPGMPSKVILEVDFEAGVIEAVPEDPLAQIMMEDVIEIRDVVEALERAADDRRVRGLVARIGAGAMAMAHIQEIRDAVMKFRESGKPTLAYSETYGEFGPGNGGYYLATAFDEVYLQPSGDVGLTGFIFESMFLRGMLDKLDVTPRMDQRHEYKNAMNMYTHTKQTAAHKEAMQVLLDSRYRQMLDGVAQTRGMTPDEVRALVDRGPFLGQEAVDAGLVDGLAYRDEAYDRIRELADDATKFLYIPAYLERAGRPHRRGETIALIHGHGGVTRGSSTFSPLTGSATMGSDTVAAAFRQATDDRRVKAILFRVDCPGGSYVASDTIRREVLRAKDAGKPVIVSMGNVAGSGGYFVAMDADHIVAQPSTITASIGVLGGKLLTRGFWNKLGITWDDVHSGANSKQWTPRHDYGPEQYARFQASLDRIYEDFTEKVAEARGIPLDEVLEIAKGRIWTGEDALELGLVDELGGFDVALRLARESVGLEADAPVRLKRFPRRRSAFEMFLGRKPESSERVALIRALKAVQPRVRALERLVLSVDPEPLSMPYGALLDN